MAQDEGVIDLTGYKDRRGARVKPGRYTVVVDDAEFGVSGSDNPMITTWLRITDSGKFEGEVIVDRMMQMESTLFRTVNFLRALGFPTPKKKLKVNVRQFVGKKLVVDLDDGEEYMGSITSDVRGYMPAAGGAAMAETDIEDVTPADEATQTEPSEEQTLDTSDDVDLDEVQL